MGAKEAKGAEMTYLIARNSFDMWLYEQWENLFSQSGFITQCSPLGYFDAKSQIDREKAQEHLETYEEFQARMKAHNRLFDGPIICREIYWR